MEKCPKCHHPLAFHRDHEGDSGARYGSSHYCDERESYDNNDFCGCTHGAPPKKEFVFYAIASDDNLEKAKWYCTYSAQKSSGWKADINDAKVWVRRSAAKSKATALGPQARLVEFHVTKTVVIDQQEHLKKVAEERRQKELKREKAAQELAIRMAKEDLARAEARLKALEGKSK